MSFTPFMNQSDVIRFAALMETFNAFSRNEYRANWQTVFVQRCDQLGLDEIHRLTMLGGFYAQAIRDEMNLIHKQCARGEMAPDQHRMIISFITRDYQEPLVVDHVDEMEWRYQCLKERAIPITKPFKETLEQRHLDELNRKIRQAKGKE